MITTRAATQSSRPYQQFIKEQYIMAKAKTEKDPYKDMANFYNNKAKEPAGGKFFTVYHHKAPAEHGVWARSKKELMTHLNKIRSHFTDIVEEGIA